MAGPGGILSLDLSLRVGWAYGALGEKPSWGHWSLGKIADGDIVYARLYDEIHDASAVNRPRAIVYEAPLPANRQDQNETATLLLGLPAIVKLCAYQLSVPSYYQHAGQARKAVLGKCPTGGAEKIKPVIIDWARRRGWPVDVTQDDEADALLLLQYSIIKLDRTGQAHYLKYGATL